MLGKLAPRDEQERQKAIAAGHDLDRVLTADDLVSSDDAFFAATGITDGDLLQGVRYRSGGGATTHSLVMRARSGNDTQHLQRARAMEGVPITRSLPY